MCDIETVLKFMPFSQALCLKQCLRSEEKSYFQNVAKQLNSIIANAPALYETDGQGESVKPVLHYFYGNTDIYITEIDKNSREHFGYTSIGYGLEAGYIDLDYIFESMPMINLDFNFKTRSISELKRRHQG